MLKLECECKGRTFFVNKKEEMIQCIRCRQRYVRSNGAWEKFQTRKEALKFLALTVDDVILEPMRKAFHETEQAFESMGQWMKRHGITREKKGKEIISTEPVKIFVVKKQKENLEATHIRKKWIKVIDALSNRYTVTFDKHYHNGKLRGRHAAKACKADLRKIGIETLLTFNGDRAAELKRKETTRRN